MKKIAFSIVVTFAFTGVAEAKQEPYFGGGVMASRCSKLLEGVNENLALGKDPLAFAILSWAEGYITATNMGLEEKGEARFDLGSLSELELWAAIYGFCKRNPEQIAVKAVIDAMIRLKRVEAELAE